MDVQINFTKYRSTPLIHQFFVPTRNCFRFTRQTDPPPHRKDQPPSNCRGSNGINFTAGDGFVAKSFLFSLISQFLCEHGNLCVGINFCTKPVEAIAHGSWENLRKATLNKCEKIGGEKMAEPKFEVYKDAKGEYRFRLKAPNGETIATGEGYVAKAGCMNGIESVKENAPKAEIVDLT
ncbi:hypothetical protein ES703_05271 [subsurface metagenome]